MRKLPRDLVLILRTEAKNQRTPPIDYVIAEDGGRMVHRPEPDIAMAELLEEAATALSAERAAHAEARKALEQAGDAIDEFYRYWTGGEQRGSYDGKPERDGLWKAMYEVRAARRALTGGKNG